MYKKAVSTSVLLMCIATMANAAPTNTGTFPGNGLMQPDYTYTNAATVTNMGADHGTVTAYAQYTDRYYDIPAGQFLGAGQETGTTCTANYYCKGLQQVMYNENNDQGLKSCADEGDRTYTLSDAGASANTDCYRACTTSNVSNSRTVTGRDYYDTGADTCAATACNTGYHLYTENILPGAIGNTAGASHSWVTYAGEPDFEIISGEEKAPALEKAMEFSVLYVDGQILFGHSFCSTQQGRNDSYTYTKPTFLANPVDESDDPAAHYCYCALDLYVDAREQSVDIPTPPVYLDDTDELFSGSEKCGDVCSVMCGKFLAGTGADKLAYRSALFATLGSPYATCEANTYNITWQNAATVDITANSAQRATYGGNINTPRKAKAVPGKHFVGWTFGSSSQN